MGHRGADWTSNGVNPAPYQGPAGFGGEWGYYTDTETGLILLGHRYYDPGTGRFLNRDPSGYNGGVNLYGFAGDNPVNEQDPSGLNPLFNFSGDTVGKGLATGWAGFSTAVWGMPGLSQLNHKYNLYSAGSLASQPGFGASVGLGNIGITVLPLSAAPKVAMLARMAQAARESKAASIAIIKASSQDWSKLSGMLRDAKFGKGNFGIGGASSEQADALGKAWVGEGYKTASDGKTLISEDGLRQYRPPSYKPKIGQYQANLEQRFEGQLSRRWQTNAHIDINR